jgi:predicted DNA-binding transcriptional regulator
VPNIKSHQEVTDEALRYLILHASERIEALALTKVERDIIDFVVKEQQVTLSEIAKAFQLKLELADEHVELLLKKGYLVEMISNDDVTGNVFAACDIAKPQLDKPCPICEIEECMSGEDWCDICCTEFYNMQDEENS